MGKKSKQGSLHIKRPGILDKTFQDFAVAYMDPIEGPDGNHTGPRILIFGKATDGYHGIKIIKKAYF